MKIPIYEVLLDCQGQPRLIVVAFVGAGRSLPEEYDSGVYMECLSHEKVGELSPEMVWAIHGLSPFKDTLEGSDKAIWKERIFSGAEFPSPLALALKEFANQEELEAYRTRVAPVSQPATKRILHLGI